MTDEKHLRKPTDKDLLKTLYIFVKGDSEGYDPNEDQVVFENFQYETIHRILGIPDDDGKDMLTVVPTGGGKSYCYQVSAMHLPGITLVISPLLALIEDQVKTLRKINFPGYERFPVACLTSDFLVDIHSDEFYYYDKKNRDANGETPASRRILNRIFSDASVGQYKLLYITPERLRSAAFVQFAKSTEISMIAVDEAHCISLWGYEFRKQYLRIPAFLNKIGYHPVIAAFTATATKLVREDIIKLLKMKGCEATTCEGDLKRRDNLNFKVYDFSAKTPSAEIRKKNDCIIRYLKDHMNERGYIYCSTAKSVDKLYERLIKEGLPCTRYYSRLDEDIKTQGLNAKFEPDENKKNNFEKFKSGEKRIMITTNALGMGIDISDIRFVIHYNVPLCLENYYQEAGRAGRTKRGKSKSEIPNSDCILFYSKEDEKTCKMLIDVSIKSSELSDSDKTVRHNIAENRLDKMKEYVVLGKNINDSNALQDLIIDYFNNYVPRKDELYKNGAETEEKDEFWDETSKPEKMNVYSDIKLPDVLLSNRTRIAQELRKGRMSTKEPPREWAERTKKRHGENPKEIPLVVGQKSIEKEGETEKHTVKYTVKYEVTGATERFTYFDMMVADAVYTLMFYGVPTICARNVMMLLSGDKKIMLRPDRKAAVEESIEKMMNAYIVIDMENSARYGFEYSEQKGKSKVIEGNFLPLYKKKGRGFGYKKGAVAPLYRYAETISSPFYGQFFTLPAKLLCFDENEPKSTFLKKTTSATSNDDFMERRVEIYKFIPQSVSDTIVQNPSSYKQGLYRRKLPPQSEKDLGTPANPLLPERFITTGENLTLLHYLICRIDIMPRLYEKSKSHSASNIIRFDTLIKTLNIDMHEKNVRRKADELWKWIVMILRHCQSLGYIKDYKLLIKEGQDKDRAQDKR